MSAAYTLERLSPDLLARLPPAVARPGYDRTALRPGIAHIGVGAFHRSHQAEYTDDLLAREFGRWGVVGINIRKPTLTNMLGRQGGLYTRLIRRDERVEARVLGGMIQVVDSQDSALPALDVLAQPDIDVVSMTVTEKGYCHRPASGDLDFDHPDIAHDLAHPEAPRSLPGLLLRALDLRRASHGRPLTLMSCDNIPANGLILSRAVTALAARQSDGLARWIEGNAAFPSSMVDRIAPAVTAADHETVAQRFGYRDDAVVVAEPFRQWVIENSFAGRRPGWDRVGATLVDDVTAFERLKMRVLNGAQTTLCHLGVLAGYEHTCDDMTDPLLVHFVERMLIEETLPTLEPIRGVVFEHYVRQSLERLRNTAIKHRNHQIATDGSQKIVQRLLNPILERLRRGEGVALLSVPVAAWMVYLIRASRRFGHAWPVEDPYAARIAAIADRSGGDPAALASEILAIEGIFDPELAASTIFRHAVTQGIAGLMAGDPLNYLRQVCKTPSTQLNRQAQSR